MEVVKMKPVFQFICALSARRSLGALLVVAVVSIALSPWAAEPVQAQQPGITSPAPGSNIPDELVPVFGTAVSNPFDKYELHYKLASADDSDSSYSYFDGGTVQVQNNQLGTWNTGVLTPGTYTIRLRVVRPDGNYAQFYSENINVGQAAPEPTETPTPTPTGDEPSDNSDNDDGGDGNSQNDGPLGPQTVSGPTETPIPTLTPTFGPSPTTSVGQVAQSASDAEATEAATPTAEAVALADTDLTDDSSTSDQSTSDVPLTAENAASSGASNVTSAEVAAPAGSQSASRELGESLSVNRLRSYFFNGIRYSAAFFIGVIALFGGKRLFDWAWMNYT